MATQSAWSSVFGSSKWPSGFGEYHKPPKPKDKDDDGGISGFMKNLVNDISDAVTGIPMGIKTMFSQSPTKTAKNMGLSFWQDWSPLFKGDVDEWWDNFTAHPLAPILDLAGLVTFGAGSAVKGVSLIGKAGGSIGKGGVVLKPDSHIVSLVGKMGGRQAGVKLQAGPGGYVRTPDVVGKGSTRTISTPGLPDVYQHFHSNPAVRGRQHVMTSLGQLVSGSKASKTSPHGSRMNDVKVVSDQGVGKIETSRRSGLVGDAARVNRGNRRVRSSRQTGFRAAMFSSMEAARKLYGDAATDAERLGIAQGLYDNARDQFVKHPMVRGAASGSGDGLAAGYVYMAKPENMAKTIDPPKSWDGKGLHDYHTRMANDGEWMTNDVNKAARDPQTGKPLIVRSNAMDKWLMEGGNTSKFLDILWNKPTLIWKAAVLAYSPRFFINNAVGNSLMYFMAVNPAGALQGLKDAYRENRNARGMDELQALQGTEFQRQLGYESQGLGAMEQAEDWNPSSRRKSRLKSGLYGMTHKVSEDAIRQATFHHAVRQTPEYWSHRAMGLDHIQSVQKAAQIPAVLDRLRQKLDNTLGNYSHLNKAERAIKKVVPFYTWDRAIVRHTRNMVSERPYLAASLVRIGEMGHDEFVKRYGAEVPHFLFNSIPTGNNILDMIPGLNDIPGRESVLSTAGMNPYGTVGELGQAAAGLVGMSDRRLGETVGSQVNPLAAAAIESISGTKLISGAPADKGFGGLLGSVYGNTAEGIPQVRLLKTIIAGPAKPKSDKPLLFRGDTSQQLLSLLGLPVKRFSPEQAEEIYWRQQGGKPGKTTKAPSSFSSYYGPKPKTPGF